MSPLFILGLIELAARLIEWLIERQKSGHALTPRQQRALSHVMAQSKQICGLGVAMGCPPEGVLQSDPELL